jgi:hypothetical protein
MKPDACEASWPPPRGLRPRVLRPRVLRPRAPAPRFPVNCPMVLRTVSNMFRFRVLAMPSPTR